MNFTKIGFEDSLEKTVVEVGKCVGCGTCVVVCPFACLEYVKDKPKLVKECKVCGICAGACPRYEWSWSKAESFIFGREKGVEESFGIYRKLLIAKAKDEEILKVSQDGGIATALVAFALEKELIDGAILSGKSREKPFYPVPKLATTRREVLECAGTKYSYSPNILAIVEALKQKKTNLAFVGTPCQIHAVRKMQMAGLKKYVTPLRFLIGLMCSESFTYEGLMEAHLEQTLGINLQEIEKMNIKGKMLVTTPSEVKAVPLKEIKQYVRSGCKLCDDFSSELADISLGGLGLNGWTFVILRTEKGKELLEFARKAGILKTRPLEKDEFALNLLVKLSAKKRKQKAG